MYQYDKQFLSSYLELIELVDGNKKVLLTPSLQGRVMTCSSNGDDGYSFGWINYDLISSGEINPHCNNWGGEDRYWLGPEGGQYAIFFEPGSSFDFKDWHAPALIDTDEWKLVSATNSTAKFTISKVLTNYQNCQLHCRLDREVNILTDEEIVNILDVELSTDLEVIGFKSSNKLTNIGNEKWSKEAGGLSIWILGQFIPSENNNIILPIVETTQASINDIYFGKIDADRLIKKGSNYYFKGDGKKRGKIGIPPQMVIPTVFALDEDNGVLTIVKFTYEEEAQDYINSLWEHQQQPYKGDVINSYNDGPLDDGSIMGGFYEIETSSKALFLASQESHTHENTTIHIKGDLPILKKIMNAIKVVS